jgi:hypothetical protein
MQPWLQWALNFNLERNSGAGDVFPGTHFFRILRAKLQHMDPIQLPQAAQDTLKEIYEEIEEAREKVNQVGQERLNLAIQHFAAALNVPEGYKFDVSKMTFIPPTNE